MRCLLLTLILNSYGPVFSQDETMIAHVTSETGGFETHIFLANDHHGAREVTGNALTPVSLTIGANRSASYSKTQLFENDDVSHFRVRGDVSVTVPYQIKNHATIPAHVSAAVTFASGRALLQVAIQNLCQQVLERPFVPLHLPK